MVSASQVASHSLKALARSTRWSASSGKRHPLAAMRRRAMPQIMRSRSRSGSRVVPRHRRVSRVGDGCSKPVVAHPAFKDRRLDARPRGDPSAASRSRRQTFKRPVPVRSHWRFGADSEMSGSRKGARPPRLATAGAPRSVACFLAFVLANLRGLSVEVSRPSVLHVHVPASPVTRPGRLLISARKNPRGRRRGDRPR